MHPHQHHPGSGGTQLLEHLLLLPLLLQAVVDDQVCAQFEVLGPASVQPRQHSPSQRVELQAHPGAAAMPAFGLAVIDILPGGPAVVGFSRDQAAGISPLQLHQTSQKQPVRQQQCYVIESH